MSNITARYVDTCLSDYLQDGYSRPGQALGFASTGCSLADTVEQIVTSVTNDEGIPACYEDSDLEAAVLAALEGVDLRYIDENGNRQDEPEDDGAWRGDEPYIYVVLEWDASIVSMRLTVDVDYHANGTDPLKLKEQLEYLIQYAVSEGLLSADLDAEVKSWGATAEEIQPEDKRRNPGLKGE